jgi:murein DD-endopeptidase MepM/ murein hydrolase activator NlpD
MARSTVEIIGGQLGGSIVQNAASEATLQELIKAVNKMNKAASGRANTMPGTTPSTQSAAKFSPMGMVSSLAGEVGEQLGNVLGSIGSLAGLIAAGNDKLSSYTTVLNDQVIKKLPLLGGALGAAGDVVNFTVGTLESWNDSLKSASQSGAAFGQNMLRLRNAAAMSYLELDDFVGIVKANSEKLIGFGDIVTEGAEAFAYYNNIVKRKGGVAREQLLQMGYSSKGVSEMMIGFMDRVMRGTRVTQIRDREFNSMFGAYALQVDRISKLTGMDAARQEQAMAGAEQDTLYQLKMNSLTKEQRLRMTQALREYSVMFPKHGAELFKAYFLGVQPASEGARVLGMMLENGSSELQKVQSAATRVAGKDDLFETALERLYVAMNMSSKSFYEQQKMTLGTLFSALDKTDGVISGMTDIITPISLVGMGADKTEDFFRKRFRDAIKEAKEREALTEFLNSVGIVITEIKNSFIGAILPFLKRLGESLEKYKLGDKFRELGAYLGGWLLHHAEDITEVIARLGSDQGRDYLFTEMKFFLKEMALYAGIGIKRAFYKFEDWANEGIDDASVEKSIQQLKDDKSAAIAKIGLDPLFQKKYDHGAQIAPVFPDGQTMFSFPLGDTPYKTTSKVGMRTHPKTGEYSEHKGLDMAAKEGTPVYAANSGVMSYKKDFRKDKNGNTIGGGNILKIEDAENNLLTKYMHLQDEGLALSNTKDTMNVKQGDRIGRLGKTGGVTGPHLHFEAWKNGKNVTGELGFKQGTMGVTGQLFKDFGGESYANISGTKAVLTPDQMNAMVKTGGAISVAELAQSLNNNMSTLITLTREKISINRAQLSETSRLSGDVFAAS